MVGGWVFISGTELKTGNKILWFGVYDYQYELLEDFIRGI